MTKPLSHAISLVACVGAAISSAVAAPIKVEATLAPREQIRLDFADGSKRFVMMVKREGKATGSSPLAGATVTEHGRHDILAGVAGDAGGYLVFTAPDGDIAYLKWLVRAVFAPGLEGKPTLLDNGVWEVVGGTGKFTAAKGAGRLNIKAVSATDRNYILEGEWVSPSGGSRK